VRAWLDKHRGFKIHFTPTSSSWLNLVECFFADLTDDVIRAGSSASVNELVRDIEALSCRAQRQSKAPQMEGRVLSMSHWNQRQFASSLYD
jgi:hypothetical protein